MAVINEMRCEKTISDRIYVCKTNRIQLCQPLGAQSGSSIPIHPFFSSKHTINSDSGQG